MAHDWTITSPAVGNKPDGVIVVTCSVCGETGTFAAIPNQQTGQQVDLEGACTPKSEAPKSGPIPLVAGN